MALKDSLQFGFLLPCRSWEPIDPSRVRAVATRADELGFSDLWVTENQLDRAYSMDANTLLGYAAALTSRIRLGVSVAILPMQSPVRVAHNFATLDHLSGGRAILGVGLGRNSDYHAFNEQTEHRVSRLLEGIRVIRALWNGDNTTKFEGKFFRTEHGFGLRPVQKGGPPIWFGGNHPNMLKRAARYGDGWMGAGGSSWKSLKEAIPALHEELTRNGKDPATFPISKRIYMSIHEDPDTARADLVNWFTKVTGSLASIDTNAFCGNAE
jgi:alkanesulfonate monooxygenase SsuD/methylene tetrahydromethanopterin reductase-like flavin-dependent oxidoreductase (luciferase family)